MNLIDQFTFFGDPFWNQVVDLNPFDGANGSTALLDISQSANAVTAVGGAVLSTTNPRFGSACLSLATPGDAASVASSTGFDLGSGDFTIEGFPNLTSFASNVYLCSRSAGPVNSNFWGLNIDPIAGLQFQLWEANVNTININQASGSGWVAGTYNHVAVSRNGNTIRLYRDGVLLASGSTAVAIPSYVAVPFLIGTFGALTALGRHDEYRVTKGVGRYPAAFTPPTAPFQTFGG